MKLLSRPKALFALQWRRERFVAIGSVTAIALVAALAAISVPNAQTHTWYSLARVSMTDPNTKKMDSRHLCFTDGDHVSCDSVSPYLSTGGLLGIGTTNPNAMLDVYGTVSATSFVGDGSGLTNLSVSGDRIVSGTSSVVVQQNGSITITTAGQESVVIRPDGTLEVIKRTNTGTPSDNAEVFVSSAHRNAAFVASVPANRAGGFVVMSDGVPYGRIDYHVTNADMRFTVSGTEKLRIVENGDVGIGTTQPTAKLSVSGTMKLSGASGAEACNAGSDGLIRRNPTTGMLQLCRP